MNNSNGPSDRDAEPPRPAELLAYAHLTAVFRDAAGVLEHTRGLFTQTLRAVTHPRDAASGFTSLVNYLANPVSVVREITTGDGSSSGDVTRTETAAPPGVTAAEQPGTGSVENLSDRVGAPPSGAAREPGGQTNGNGLSGGLLGALSWVAARPVGMIAETLRQVQQVQQGVAPSQAIDNMVSSFLGTPARDYDGELTKRGRALIQMSAKPESQRRGVHPSFSNILDELLPDEARVLRFLAVAGTQPAIDMRTKTFFQVGSVKLVGGVNMITEMSGCKWADRGYHYLANLNRLGLIDFSKEPVDDYRRYALLEVQPAATAAVARAAKVISVYRSIGLTSFGRQFVNACIDTDGYDGGGWATDGRADKIMGKGPPA
jgi:hypothetical protein